MLDVPALQMLLHETAQDPEYKWTLRKPILDIIEQIQAFRTLKTALFPMLCSDLIDNVWCKVEESCAWDDELERRAVEAWEWEQWVDLGADSPETAQTHPGSPFCFRGDTFRLWCARLVHKCEIK